MRVCSMPVKFKAATLLIGVAIAAGAANVAAQSQTAPSASAPRQSSASPVAALPDVVGIRPGISAQEAYDLLKARAPRAKIGVGQFPVAGVTDKPVPISMAVNIPEAEPSEVITVWLTTPPGSQVVWAVGRTILFEPNKQLLKSEVIAGLRQKYGREADEQYEYWAFDEQGRRSDNAGQKGANCISRANWSLSVAPPEAATYASFTPLLYAPVPPNACSSLIEVRTELLSSQNNGYVQQVTVIMSDLALARRSQEAYQAVLGNDEAARKKAELERARQQKGPTF
jgi:hypothetical protein